MTREHCTTVRQVIRVSPDGRMERLDINRLINWKARAGAFYDLYGAEVVRLIHHKFMRC